MQQYPEVPSEGFGFVSVSSPGPVAMFFFWVPVLDRSIWISGVVSWWVFFFGLVVVAC